MGSRSSTPGPPLSLSNGHGRGTGHHLSVLFAAASPHTQGQLEALSSSQALEVSGYSWLGSDTPTRRGIHAFLSTFLGCCTSSRIGILGSEDARLQCALSDLLAGGLEARTQDRVYLSPWAQLLGGSELMYGGPALTADKYPQLL